MTPSSLNTKLHFILNAPTPWMDKISLLLWTSLLYWYSLSPERNKKVTKSRALLKIKYLGKSLHLRLMDLGVFYDVFMNETYRPPKEWIFSDSPLILDLGGHIGLTSIYFYDYFKGNAIIHSVEPNPANYKLLEQNLEGTGIKTYRLAISNFNGLGKISDTAFGFNSSLGRNGANVPVSKPETFIQRYIQEKIDLLKIDVEGEEKQILESIALWGPEINHLMMEYHHNEHKKVENTLENFGIIYLFV